jgi:transposase-like protein
MLPSVRSVRDPFSLSFGCGREKGSEAVSPVAMVWPCPLPVDAYAAAGRGLEFPRPVCPSCAGRLVFWSGYRRHVRASGRCRKIFVPRVRCAACGVSHALLPAFALAWRLDAAETVGAVITQVAGGACGVRPAAARAGVPYTTARGWVRRFRARGLELGTGFAALAAELGGPVIGPAAGAGRFALAAIGAAFGAAAALPGWLAVGVWRFASSATGGCLIAANTTSPFLVVGGRRFMPPVPP